MEYAAFAFWLLLIVITGIGLYRLWTSRIGGAAVDWLMLPATLVGELAYSCGRLLTGRPAYGGLISPRDASNDPCRNAISGRFGFLVAMLSSLMTFASTGTVLLLMVHFLGDDVIRSMVVWTDFFMKDMPQEVPASWGGFWDVLGNQIDLLRRICETWADLNWRQWQIPVFVYGTAIFAVRFAPVRHNLKPTLATAAILIVLIVAAAAMIEPFGDFLTGNFWFYLTYLWSVLLFLLAVTVVLHGAALLVRIFIPKRSGGGRSSAE